MGASTSAPEDVALPSSLFAPSERPGQLAAEPTSAQPSRSIFAAEVERDVRIELPASIFAVGATVRPGSINGQDRAPPSPGREGPRGASNPPGNGRLFSPSRLRRTPAPPALASGSPAPSPVIGTPHRSRPDTPGAVQPLPPEAIEEEESPAPKEGLSAIKIIFGAIFGGDGHDGAASTASPSPSAARRLVFSNSAPGSSEADVAGRSPGIGRAAAVSILEPTRALSPLRRGPLKPHALPTSASSPHPGRAVSRSRSSGAAGLALESESAPFSAPFRGIRAPPPSRDRISASAPAISAPAMSPRGLLQRSSTFTSGPRKAIALPPAASEALLAASRSAPGKVLAPTQLPFLRRFALHACATGAAPAGFPAVSRIAVSDNAGLDLSKVAAATSGSARRLLDQRRSLLLATASSGGISLLIILPPILASAPRIVRRALKAAEGVLPEVGRAFGLVAQPGKDKKKQSISSIAYELGFSHSDLLLDMALDGASQIGAVFSTGIVPHTVAVYARELLSGDFDSIARTDVEMRSRWALRTPSKKPVILVVFDASKWESFASSKQNQDNIKLADGFRQEVQARVLQLGGYSAAFRYVLQGYRDDCPAGPGTPTLPAEAAAAVALLWRRGGAFVQDRKLEREIDGTVRAPYIDRGATAALESLGFTNGREQLGKGGFSHVALWSLRGRPFAIKVQRPRELKEADRQAMSAGNAAPLLAMPDSHLLEARVHRELLQLGAVKKCTPNFVQLWDWMYVPRDASQLQIMERCEMNLTDFLELFDESQPAGFVTALRGALAQVCIALHHASALGFRHSDFKAHNVLLLWHPEPRAALFPNLHDKYPTQPFDRRFLHYRFGGQSFVFDLTATPLVKICDYGKSILAPDMDPAEFLRGKLWEASDLAYMVWDLLWRAERLKNKSLAKALSHPAVDALFSALAGCPLAKLRRPAQQARHPEEATFRELYGPSGRDMPPLEVLASGCFDPERREAIPGVAHTWGNTALFAHCPHDELPPGLAFGSLLPLDLPINM
eukprot:tig00000144_g8996.t1